jgi:hypothetical protein
MPTAMSDGQQWTIRNFTFINSAAARMKGTWLTSPELFHIQ